MPQMTMQQIRVVDPVLTTIAQAFPSTEGFVGNLLFPTVFVGQRGGKIIEFGKEAFTLYTNIQRAPGSNTKRVQFGFSGKSYALNDYSLEGMVPIEHLQEASAVPGIDLATQAIRTVQSIIELRLEKEQADLALNPANYGAGSKITLSGTSQFSNAASTPISAIETGREAIRSQTGRYPNLMVMGPLVATALKHHGTIIGRTQYTSPDSITPAVLGGLLGIPRVVVAQSIYYDDAGVQKDMWGKNVLLAYVAPTIQAAMGLPSYGYTYRLAGGYPLVETPYLERNPKTWLYPVTDVVAPVISSALAGYLITDAVA